MSTGKMTIYYKKNNLNIFRIKKGVANLIHINDYIGKLGLEKDEIETFFGYIHIDYNEQIMKHMDDFYLEKQEDGSLELKMKDKVKVLLQKYI